MKKIIAICLVAMLTVSCAGFSVGFDPSSRVASASVELKSCVSPNGPVSVAGGIAISILDAFGKIPFVGVPFNETSNLISRGLLGLRCPAGS